MHPGDEVLIGRGLDCDVTIASRGVSGHHALLRCRPSLRSPMANPLHLRTFGDYISSRIRTGKRKFIDVHGFFLWLSEIIPNPPKNGYGKS